MQNTKETGARFGLAAVLMVCALAPAGAMHREPLLSPVPHLGPVIAHQGNEALRIIRAQALDDIRGWALPVPALESDAVAGEETHTSVAASDASAS